MTPYHCSYGVVYEGVPDDILTGGEVGDPQKSSPRKRTYLGGSGGQSASIECIDAFLGIEHTTGAYLRIR